MNFILKNGRSLDEAVAGAIAATVGSTPIHYNIGPGTKNRHRGNGRYTGYLLRKIRAERGVGRPVTTTEEES